MYIFSVDLHDSQLSPCSYPLPTNPVCLTTGLPVVQPPDPPPHIAATRQSNLNKRQTNVVVIIVSQKTTNDSSQLISTTVYNHNLLTTCFSKTSRATFTVSEHHKHTLVCIHPPITFLSYLFVSTHDTFFHAMVPACTHSQPRQISDRTFGVQLTILLERQDSAAVLLFPSSIITEGVRKILFCRLHRPTRVQRLQQLTNQSKYNHSMQACNNSEPHQNTATISGQQHGHDGNI